jgi:hypothetical protein
MVPVILVVPVIQYLPADLEVHVVPEYLEDLEDLETYLITIYSLLLQ